MGINDKGHVAGMRDLAQGVGNRHDARTFGISLGPPFGPRIADLYFGLFVVWFPIFGGIP